MRASEKDRMAAEVADAGWNLRWPLGQTQIPRATIQRILGDRAALHSLLQPPHERIGIGGLRIVAASKGLANSRYGSCDKFPIFAPSTLGENADAQRA